MNTARQLGFSASLDSRHSRHSPQANQNDQQSTEPPSLRNEGESGIICQCCNDRQYLRINEHEVERCPFC